MTDQIAAIRPALRELFDANARREPGAEDLCATFSVVGDEDAWMQVQLGIVNFAYPRSDDPLEMLRRCGIAPLPGLEVATFKPGLYATLTFASCAVDDLARFIDALLGAVHTLPPGYAIDARMESL